MAAILILYINMIRKFLSLDSLLIYDTINVLGEHRAKSKLEWLK